MPHFEHACADILADVHARFQRMCGLDVFTLAGLNELDARNDVAAQLLGISPVELVDMRLSEYKRLWNETGSEFNGFIRTSERRHSIAAARLWERLQQGEYLYQKEFSGCICLECHHCRSGDAAVCPDCGSQTEVVTEEACFFRLSAFQEKLIHFYEGNPGLVVPASLMSSIANSVKVGLEDVCVSRSHGVYGLPVQMHQGYRFCGWLNELIAYLSGACYGTDDEFFERRWPADVQIVNRGALRAHAVYWPAILMAAGLEVPHRVLPNSWGALNVGDWAESGKGSFSVPGMLAQECSDTLRYFLSREIPVGGEGTFSLDAMVSLGNSELANDIGNLVNRTLTMIQDSFNGIIPEKGTVEARDEQLFKFCRETVDLYCENFARFQIDRSLDNVWELLAVTTRYLNSNEPWTLTGDRSRYERLGAVLYNLAEAIRIIAGLLGPVVPKGAGAILAQLNVAKSLEEFRLSDLKWGGLEPGRKIGPINFAFRRLDLEELLRGPQVEEAKRPPSISEPDDARISIEDFSRVVMRVGEVVSAEPIQNSSKLLCLQVKLGSEVRQVVAGIGKAYKPSDLVGRRVVVVTNLKPVVLMGVESNGMIVAAEDGGKPVLATFTEEIALGARLR